MDKISVRLFNGKKDNFNLGSSVLEVIKKNYDNSIEDILLAKVNGFLVDLLYSIKENAEIELITFKNSEGKEVLRHSAAHIMAQAIKRLYPEVKYAAGPAIKNGFYYDMKLFKSLIPKDLENIEKQIREIVKEKYKFKRSELFIDEAISFFEKRDDFFKINFLKKFKTQNIKKVSIYQQAEFIDLCRGPHIFHTGQLRAFKLLNISGSYWKGDSRNTKLQRVYGTAFFREKDLKIYLNILEEAKKRDHRKLGKELDFFSFQEEAPGFPFWHPKGTKLYDFLLNFIQKENQKRNYQEVKSPLILNESLWQKSGHSDNFKDNMYFTQIDNRNFAIKPMNCPAHCLIYKNTLHSYRELPIRLSEFGLVHRNELSGVLHGLFRARSFTQDDGHIFCTENQLKEEIKEIIKYTIYTYKKMGFNNYLIYVATRPEKYIGSKNVWDQSISNLTEALIDLNLDYKIKEGEGAFYGPKIEFNIKDSLQRNWQCGTVQVDFSMPKHLGLKYEGSDGQKHVPVMIHRAILGSMERFIGILIEHYAGKLPLWLAPTQIKLIFILPEFDEYLKKIEHELFLEGFRIKKDLTNEKLGYKIRKAQLEKIPYMLIIGNNEKNTCNVSVRSRDKGNLGLYKMEDFIKKLKNELELNEI